jgi:putative transposase
VEITVRHRRKLLEIITLPSAPESVVLHAAIVLGAAQGIPNKALARQLGARLPMLLPWRRRFSSQGLARILEDQPRSGRPKHISPKQEAARVEKTLRTSTRHATHCRVPLIARAVGLSPATLQRIWERHHFQPHRLKSFKFSTKPESVAKVREIVGL